MGDNCASNNQLKATNLENVQEEKIAILDFGAQYGKVFIFLS